MNRANEGGPNGSDPIARRARDVFDAASGNLDATMGGRLRLARRHALGARRAPARWLAPATLAIAISLVFAAWWSAQRKPATESMPVVVQPQVPAAPVPQVEPEVPIAPMEPVAAPDGQQIVAIEPGSPDEAALDDDVVATEDPQWAADEDVELYAWLADAPVAPDTEGDAL
ncbi:MAG: hypothetical protein ACREO3_06715 [Arenimonas sp.]